MKETLTCSDCKNRKFEIQPMWEYGTPDKESCRERPKLKKLRETERSCSYFKAIFLIALLRKIFK